MLKITTELALFKKIVVIQDLVNHSPLHFEYMETIWKQWIKLHKQEYAYSNAKVNKLTTALINREDVLYQMIRATHTYIQFNL